MRVNVGCGRRPLQGYVNLDLVRYPDVDYAGVEFRQVDARDLSWWEAAPLEEIRADQFLEHLTRDEGLAWLRECRRVIAPTGVLRLTVPDFGAHAADYASREQTVRLSGWLRDRLLQDPVYDLVDEVRIYVLHGEGHRMHYDARMLRRALEATGWEVARLDPDGANIAVTCRPA